jgi:hypothetical protein
VGNPDAALFIAHDRMGSFDTEPIVFASHRHSLGFFQPVPQEQLMNFTHRLIRQKIQLASTWTLLTQAI